jgi:hypothetical protein
MRAANCRSMKARATLVAIFLVLGIYTPGAQAASPAILAVAGFGLVGDAHHGYLANFTVRSGFTTSPASPLELVYEVHTCSFDSQECELTSQHVVPLGEGAFVSHADGTATLRTRWAKQPLVVRWQRGGQGHFAANTPTVVYVFTNHEEVLTGGVSALNASAVASSILGNKRGCIDSLSSTFAAQAGASQDLLARLSDTPDAADVPGLGAGHGRCYQEAAQPKSMVLQRARVASNRVGG